MMEIIACVATELTKTRRAQIGKFTFPAQLVEVELIKELGNVNT